MIEDRTLTQAVARIVQRAERHASIDKLVTTYVEVGILPQLDNVNHQIFYGRRGTGKTHLLKVLKSELNKDSRNATVYIDCRTLGSTSQFADANLPMHKRCLALFRDILISVCNDLLEHIVEHVSENATQVIEKLDELQKVVSEPIRSLNIEKITTQDSSSNKRGTNLSAGVNLFSKSGTAGSSINRETGTSSNQGAEYSVKSEDKIVFPELHKILDELLRLSNTSLFILINEWADLPRDIQPYLAEFLKRGVLPVQAATVKISALEYRCQFNYRSEHKNIGFELGADIATAIDLDDYFVFDRNPEQILSIYSDILIKHLESELPPEYLKEKYSINSGDDLATRLFTGKKAFSELARASEGVVRDLINIFTKSFFNSQKKSRQNIDKKSITDSAQQWFEQDKAQYLDERLTGVLQRIVNEVIGNKKARAFLLPRQLEKNVIIQGLFDARVLHHLQRGYADKDNPGVRYNIYSVDYGTYVDLIGTSKQPELELFPSDQKDGADEEVLVPFDDKR